MIDRQWVVSQIADKYGDTDDPTGPCLFFIFDSLYTLPPEKREAAIDELESLLHGLELLPSGTYRPRKWVPAAQYHGISEVARVRPDLLIRNGWTLNGRVGKIIGKRRGDIIIHFDKPVPDAPLEYRGVITDFEVDISNLDKPQKGHHQKS